MNICIQKDRGEEEGRERERHEFENVRQVHERGWREERKRQSVMSLHFILKIIPLKVVKEH